MCSASAAHSASDYVWSKEAAQLFTDELKNYEELWNVKCEKFKNRDARRKTLQKILEHLQFHAIMNENTTLKRINTVRPQFRKEMSKVIASKNSVQVLKMRCKCFFFSLEHKQQLYLEHIPLSSLNLAKHISTR